MLLQPTRKMSVHSLRIRSTQGSSSNMMEWLIPLKNSLTNLPITKTTEAYNPMMLRRRRGAGTEEQKMESKEATGEAARATALRRRSSVPVSSQKPQTWRTDFVTEHQELQSSLPLAAPRSSAPHRNQAGDGLVHNPPLLDLDALIGALQRQQDVLVVLV